ncbi:glycosyltransferase [Salibacterium sp. K-3]
MKVLLVPAIPKWAFDNRARDLAGLEFKHVQLQRKYLQDVTARDQKRYDLIYPMSLSIARKLYSKGIPYDKMASAITSERLYDGQRNPDGSFKTSFHTYLNQFRGINAWSGDIIQTLAPVRSIYKTRIGIHHKKFRPDPVKKNNTFTVGWAGRIDKPNYRELKGYDIVRKALKDLPVKLDIRTFKERFVPHAQMVPFYQQLDCFICSSRSEGLPNPVLEAASCGVPIISTKVGFVPELIQHQQNGIIVPRNAVAIRRAVQQLLNHPEKKQAMTENIRRTVLQNWTWRICKHDWERFFLSLR